MTLIAALAPHDHPLILGDILISAGLPASASPVSPEAPFLPSAGLTLPPSRGATRRIVTTRQKVYVVTNALAVAWSGPYLPARRIIEAMFSHFSPGPLSQGDVPGFFARCDYDDLYRSGLSLVGSYYGETGGTVFGFNARDDRSPRFGSYHAAGSGSRPLIEFIQNLSTQKFDFPGTANNANKTLWQALFLAGSMLGREDFQSLYDLGYGGFYEVVSAFNAVEGFVKISNIVYMYWFFSWDSTRKRGQIRLILLLKPTYINDILVVRRVHFSYHEKRAPTRHDAIQFISPIYRDISLNETQGDWAIATDGAGVCHTIYVEPINENRILSIVEISPAKRMVTITEEKEGRLHLGIGNEFIEYIIENVQRRPNT